VNREPSQFYTGIKLYGLVGASVFFRKNRGESLLIPR